MSKKKESFFWTSYSDLMTSLFFIMLVLFILVIVLLHERIKTTTAHLNKITAIMESTKDLPEEYFDYQSEYEKYILKVSTFFPRGQSDINLLSDSARDSLAQVGEILRDFLKEHNDNKYLIIIEGQASKDSPEWSKMNYDLSFQRAQSLKRFWFYEKNLTFGDNCEVQISGSGDGAISEGTMRDNVNERNQRFLIYIIPKNIIK